MPTVIFQHDVEDRDHWQKSPLREEKFGPLGVTNIRTFVDPSNDKRVAISADIPDLPKFLEWLQSEDGAATAQSDGVVIDTMVVLIESGG